eukprot:Polyplicarium_translucidae@DN2838_c1_g2_i2.p1
MPVTRLKFLAALSGGVGPLPYFERDAWKALYNAEPLATYILAKKHFPSRREVSCPQGLLALPTELLSILAHFLGTKDTYGVLFNLCRAAALLSSEIRFDYMELKARALWLHEDFKPTPEELYRLYWRIEKLIAIRGHYWLRVFSGRKRWRFSRSRPLFEGPEVDWRTCLRDVIAASPTRILPHIRMLTVPASSKIWSSVNAVSAAPNSTQSSADQLSAISHALHNVHFPNLVELYAINVEQAHAIHIEKFLSLHSHTVRVFVGPQLGKGERTDLGHASAGFPFLNLQSLGQWQFASYHESGPSNSKWPRFFKGSVEKAIGFSCNVGSRKMRIVSFPPSLEIYDIVANIRAMVVEHLSGCTVLAKIGELRMSLLSLSVGACSSRTACMARTTDIADGLGKTERLTVTCRHASAPVCVLLYSMLFDGSFNTRQTADGNIKRVVFSKKEAQEDARSALCTSLVDRLRDTPAGSQLRVQVWHAVEPCEHRRVFRRIAEERGARDLSWFVRDCRCNLSWNARISTAASTEVASVRSPEDHTSPERKILEHHYETAGQTEDGRWGDAAHWMRYHFCMGMGSPEALPQEEGGDDQEW